MPGVRAEIEIEEPTGCPLARAAADTTATVRDRVTDGDEVVEEVRAADELGGGALEAIDETASVYRLRRPEDVSCLCDRLRNAGHPISDATVEDGRLRLTLHLPDAADFEDLIGRLQEAANGVSVRSLTRSGRDDGAGDPVTVDRDKLTARQRQVLETALEMGYYEYPRAANASEVAEELDVSPSTAVEHLTLAEAKLFDDAFEA